MSVLMISPYMYFHGAIEGLGVLGMRNHLPGITVSVRSLRATIYQVSTSWFASYVPPFARYHRLGSPVMCRHLPGIIFLVRRFCADVLYVFLYYFMIHPLQNRFFFYLISHKRKMSRYYKHMEIYT